VLFLLFFVLGVRFFVFLPLFVPFALPILFFFFFFVGFSLVFSRLFDQNPPLGGARRFVCELGGFWFREPFTALVVLNCFLGIFFCFGWVLGFFFCLCGALGFVFFD